MSLDENLILFIWQKNFHESKTYASLIESIQYLPKDSHPYQLFIPNTLPFVYQSDAGWEEYYDYIFPEDAANQPNLKLLAMAKMWKKQQQEDEKEEDDEEGQQVPQGNEAEDSSEPEEQGPAASREQPENEYDDRDDDNESSSSSSDSESDGGDREGDKDKTEETKADTENH